MLRVLTVINIALWAVLFLAWVPYTLAVGIADPISSEVRGILVVSILLMALLGLLRVRRHRPVLG